MFMSQNKVIRRYVVEPVMNGKTGRRFEFGLRYTEGEAIVLHRDSEEALAEALDFARREGLLPSGVNATVRCVRESLREA